ncbi:MAG: TonB-dependent receptor [Pseudomonadota bacterium]
MTKSMMLAGVAAFALLGPSVAFAQEAAPAVDDAPADIVVTAQKRSERLQDVPVAVSVVSGAALESQGKASLEGAVNLVPSFNFLKSGTTLNQSLFLRGVGTSTFSIAGEPSVSTVVDGVVYSRSGEAFSELVDIDRMEVLRGPQGTLFGKNASAGVINIVSQRPSADFGGYVEAGYFTENEYRLRGAVNLPLGDNVRTRLNGFYTKYDGNITNFGVAGNPKVNGWEHYGGRLAIDIDFSPTVSLSLNADYHKNKDNCCAEIIATPPIVGATGATTTNASQAALPTPNGDQTRAIAQDLITQTLETGYGFSAQLNAEVGNQTFTSITAYRNWENTEIRDGDFLPAAYIGFNQLHDFGPQTGDTFSQEFRLTSPGKQFFDYVIGAYYSQAYSRRIFTRNDIVCTSAVTPAPTALTPCTSPLAAPSTTPSGTADFGSTFKNLAFFGQGTLNFSDRFRLIAGIRYTADDLEVFHKRTTTGLVLNGAGIPQAAPGIQPVFDQGVFDAYNALVASGVSPTVALQTSLLSSNGVPFRTKTSNTNWSGKAGVQFDISRNSMIYGTYARGYKGPAYNIFYNLTATGTNAISPETSDAYEIGLKNTLFGGKLVLNLAGYYAKYYNFQANNPDLVAGVVVSRFTNAGEVSTRGGEVDIIWRPVRDLSISGGAAYTDARVDQFFAAPGAAASAIVPSGTPLAFAPKFKGSLSADYRWRTGGPVDFMFGAQTSYQSSQLASFSPDPILRQLATIHDYGLVNLSAGVTDADGRWRVIAQVRNLLDQSFAAAIINGGPGGAYRYQIPRDADRYFGITARINFGGQK